MAHISSSIAHEWVTTPIPSNPADAVDGFTPNESVVNTA
jgi:hypothetical protein